MLRMTDWNSVKPISEPIQHAACMVLLCGTNLHFPQSAKSELQACVLQNNLRVAPILTLPWSILAFYTRAAGWTTLCILGNLCLQCAHCHLTQ